ncbi:MAG: DUF3108 domain-containing protein [Flavisolibacter sp.]
MRMIHYSLCFCLVFALQAQAQNNFCGIKNTTTQNGEEITYTIFYSLAGAHVNAGTTTFSNKVEKLNGRTVYHATGVGGSNTKYDWIYKVRDRYESYIDTQTMQPLKFFRDVNEGSTKKMETVNFNHSNNTATNETGTYKVPSCVQDVLSTIYYARNVDFDKYKKGDKIPFQMFLENQVYDLYIRYFGKEELKTKYGKFNAIKFKVLLIPGTIFKGGEDMVVWVSDDENHVPVRIESQILVGSIKVDMTGYKNLRYPLSVVQKKKK